jgi:hypothetical protein
MKAVAGFDRESGERLFQNMGGRAYLSATDPLGMGPDFPHADPQTCVQLVENCIALHRYMSQQAFKSEKMSYEIFKPQQNRAGKFHALVAKGLEEYLEEITG